MSPRNATRRHFLQASGISLGLPLLEAFGKAAETPPKRALFICNTLGFYSPAFFPKEAGPDYEASEYLALLGDHRNDFAVDQTASLPQGKHFRPIGTVDLVADTETIIQITNANTAGFVILDALQLLPIKQ